ncbi:MAG: peptide ABC transporter substrate-binding protein [Fimbriimonadaceae bacterium]|nr:peptide ABC transporter substrate-binding protein [Fimbriimonadaceae bacterium]
MKGWMAGVLLATALLAGCSGGGGGFSDRGRTEATSQILRYPINTNPTTYDPAVVQDGDTIDLLQNIYEGLVGWDENSQVVGILAQSWTVDEAGTTYTFEIRPEIKFHNGRLVTADDVKWSFERATEPGLKSETATAYLSDIVGLEEKAAGTAEEITGIKVLGPRTISIEVKKPTPYFLGKLTYLVGAVLPKESVPADREITQVSEMVGTGPFKVTETIRDQITKLTANADYWGGAPKLAGIERPVVKDALSVINKYRTGEIEMARLQRQDIPGIQREAELADQLKKFDRPAIWYIGMNQIAYRPFADRRVRRAFAMAINKERIVNELMGGANTPAYGILPPGVQGHREKAAAIDFNPTEAKALLAEAGFPNGQGLPPLEMFFREQFADIKLVAEAVAGDLKEHLNVTVSLRPLEWGSYLQKYNAKELPFYHMRWSADFLDPQNFLSHMLTTNGPENKFGYSNAEYDRLCAEADSLMDWEKRRPLYEKAEDIVLQDAPWVPIYFQRDAELHSKRLSGLRTSAFGHLPHTTTELTSGN